MADKKQSISLVGIDSPEKSCKKNEPGQQYSQKATNFLSGLALNREVSIEVYGKDRYGRVLGLVYAGQTNVNLELVPSPRKASSTASTRLIASSSITGP